MQGDTPHVVNPNGGEKQAEIYTHDAPWLIYACNWSVRCLLLFTFLYYVCVVFKVAKVVLLGGVFFEFFLRAYRIGCDPREWIYVPSLCHRAQSALFFVSLRSDKKKTTFLTLTKHHSLSRSLGIIIIVAFFSCVR